MKSSSLLLIILLSFPLLVVGQDNEQRARSAYLNAEDSFNQGQYGDATKMLYKAKELLGHTNTKIQYLLVKSLSIAGLYSNAQQELAIYLKLARGKESDEGDKYAEMLRLVDRLNTAIDKTRQAIDKNEYSTLCSKANEKFTAGDVEQGVFFMNKAVDSENATADDYLKLSAAYAYLGNDKLVMEYLKKDKLIKEIKYEKILDVYLFAKYYNNPDFQDFLKTNYGDEAILLLKNNIQQFNKLTGKFEIIQKNRKEHYDSVLGQNIVTTYPNMRGSISVDLDEKFNFIVTGFCDYIENVSYRSLISHNSKYPHYSKILSIDSNWLNNKTKTDVFYSLKSSIYNLDNFSLPCMGEFHGDISGKIASISFEESGDKSTIYIYFESAYFGKN